MKRLFLPSIVVLLLATGAAHADNREWESSFRRCEVWKNFTHKDEDTRPGLALGDRDEIWLDEAHTDGKITLSMEDIVEFQKHLPLLKKCTAFYQCLRDREAGKVKHCYENDRRWR
jgi:hypothetical protein